MHSIYTYILGLLSFSACCLLFSSKTLTDGHESSPAVKHFRPWTSPAAKIDTSPALRHFQPWHKSSPWWSIRSFKLARYQVHCLVFGISFKGFPGGSKWTCLGARLVSGPNLSRGWTCPKKLEPEVSKSFKASSVSRPEVSNSLGPEVSRGQPEVSWSYFFDLV